MYKKHKEHDLNITIEDVYCHETRYLLSRKIEKLEKFVFKLQGEPNSSRYIPRQVDWEDDGTLESPIRRNKHEVKCDECEYRAQNKA